MKRCYLAEFAPEHLKACDGRLQRAHVISRMRLKRQFPHGVAVVETKAGALSVPLQRVGVPTYLPVEAFGALGEPAYRTVSLPKLLKDERDMVDACVRHHQLLDNARFYVTEWPASVQEFADELGLGWVLERQAA